MKLTAEQKRLLLLLRNEKVGQHLVEDAYSRKTINSLIRKGLIEAKSGYYFLTEGRDENPKNHTR